MRDYELTVLIHPDLEADLDKPLGLIRKIVKDNKGEVTLEDNWGKKKLAYKIAKESFANYVYFEVKLPAEAVKKISQTLNITDEVLRYLLVSVDEKARQALSEAKARADAKEED
jgi:small subunit ribosomal protein S6